MKRSNCVLLAGTSAAKRIREEGLRQEQFSTLVGASGGPKWLVISQLDRVLMGEFFKGRSQPVATVGSSIGSFRNMCYAMEDSLGALERLEFGYIHQTYDSGRPTPVEITAAGEKILRDALGGEGARQVANSPIWHSHFVTVRGRGPLASERRALLAPALLASALANAMSRHSLRVFWDRVVFHNGDSASVHFDSLRTVNTRLSEENVCDAVLASGSIPLVMAGVQNPHGAPAGNYRDGGITDYHFDLRFGHPEGLALYPHFFPYMVPGWFDKSLFWRRVRGGDMQNTLLVSPSPAFVARLPYGKIPDRNDFYKLSTEERLKYWNRVVDMSRQVADDFYELWQTGAVADHLIEVGSEDIPHKLSRVTAA
ncbi:patatin-like phospholipase family protein [Microbulbifer taiwanensis]|uniref:Patatin-like phospholipase family protein n=1 Tax=Microbulbifer taiwanensis TaxID=986746 RepID=A0ABW1YH50_9GAMM|nr:patatin-like phospholipase family protein [Microbulbifer taiwanensis]